MNIASRSLLDMGRRCGIKVTLSDLSAARGVAVEIEADRRAWDFVAVLVRENQSEIEARLEMARAP